MGSARSVPAYVIGEGNTDLTRALGLAGIRSVAMASPVSTARFSRFVSRTLPVVDPWTQPERLVETLIRAGAREEGRPVLVYQGDGHALVVSRFRERLEPYFRFSIPSIQLTEELNDKLQFQKLAERLGLPVPAAIIVHPMSQDAPPELPFGYPIVVKPTTRSVHHWSDDGGKASFVSDRAELDALWSKLAGSDAWFVIQELVAGPESEVVSYHAYVADDGTVVGEFTGEKIRTNPAVFGHSSSVRVVSLPAVREVGRDLISRLDFSGVVKLDFKIRPDGQFALFEVNTKFNLWHLPGAIAGVNIPALVYDDLMGNGRPTEKTIEREGVVWCKVWDDLPIALEEDMPFRQWLRWVRTVDSVRDLALDDPLPVIGLVLMGTQRGFIRVRRMLA